MELFSAMLTSIDKVGNIFFIFRTNTKEMLLILYIIVILRLTYIF